MATAGSGLCPVLATHQNGIITAANADSLVVSTTERSSGTRVKITCYWDEVYTIKGDDEVTCVRGRWVPDPPTCVRKDSTSGGGDGGETTTAGPGSPSSSSDSESLTTVIILVSVACAVVVLVLALVLIYRLCCMTRSAQKYKHVKEDYRSDESLYSGPSLNRSLIHRVPPPVGLSKPGWFRSPSDPESLWAPPSLWSVPPSQRYNPYSYHLHEQHVPPSVRSPTQVSINASWGGTSASREWTYLSVDRLLRDIEASRKNNPNHSWRDFAALSSEVPGDGKQRRL